MAEVTVITGEAVRLFQAKVILKAIDMWTKHKIRVNTAYTPANMRTTAERITGKKFASLAAAYLGLKSWIEANEQAR